MSEPETPEVQQEAAAPKLRPRRRWLPYVLGVVVFICGCIVGAGGTVLIIRQHLLHAVKHPEEAPPRITKAMRRHLGLSDSQAQEVEQIIRKHQKRLQSIRAEAQPQVVEVLRDVEAEVAEVLDDRQKEKWHTKLKRLRELWMPPAPAGD